MGFGMLGVAVGILPAVAQLPATRLTTVFPPGGQAGTTVEVTVQGADLEEPARLAFSHPGITAQLLDLTRFKVTIASNVPPGTHDVRYAGRFGLSNPRRFTVGSSPEFVVTPTNSLQTSAIELPLQRTCYGRLPARTFAWFKFTAKKSQRVFVECLAPSLDSRLDATLAVLDGAGREWERSRTTGLLDFTAPADGTYFVRLTDFLYRGGDDYFYRLTLSTGPRVDFILPLVGVAGTKTNFTLYGRNLPGGKPVKGLTIDGKPLEQVGVTINLPPAPADRFASSLPASAALDTIEYRFKGANPVQITLLDQPVPIVLEQEPNSRPDQAQTITPPCEVSALFHPGADVDRYVFTAKKGDAYWLEIVSQRLGLPTAPHLLVQRITKDDKGAEKATDVLDLTDYDVNLGDREFNTSSRDPVGRFEATEDGTYRIEVRDLFSPTTANPSHTYRLSIRRPSPDFRLVAQTITPKYKADAKNLEFGVPVIRRGETLPVRVMAFRRDGFNGDIELALASPPPGLHLATDRIEAGKNSDAILLTAAADAPAFAGPLRLTGRAKIGDREVTRIARGGSLVFPVGNTDTERPRARATPHFELAVTDQEFAPLSIAPAENRPFDAPANGKLEIPLVITRRAEFNANLKLKPIGPGPAEALKEFDVDGKATNATLKLDLAALKLAPGRYLFAVQTITTGKYRNNPEAAAFAEATAKEAEKAANDAAAAAKKAAEVAEKSAKDSTAADTAAKAAADALATAKAAVDKAPADEALRTALAQAQKSDASARAAAQAAATARDEAAKAKAAADAHVKQAQARKDETAKRAKDAAEKAKPRDVSYQLTSAPILVQVNPAQVAENKDPKAAAK